MQSAASTPTARPTPAEASSKLARAFRTFETFAGLLDVLDKRGRRVKFRLNQTQRAYVARRTSRDVILKSRQVGITLVVLALMLYRFLTVPGANVVIVCQAMEGDVSSKKQSRTIETMIQSLERLGVAIDFTTRTEKLWELKSGATLQIIVAGASAAAAEKKGRSQTITHLHLTECAYWEYAESTLRALFPCVPGPETGSEIVMECTANGAVGPFYEHCEMARRGESEYAFHFFPWFTHEEYVVALEPGEVVAPRTERQHQLVEHHGVGQEQLKYWQTKVASERGDEEYVNQEYPSDPDTCFLVAGRGFFDATKIGEMLAGANPPIRVQSIRGTGVVPMRDGRAEVPVLRVWHLPVEDETYVVSCDTSEGDGGSAGGAAVLERLTGRHMATLWGQFQPWTLARYAVPLARRYGNAELVVERNNHGLTVLRAAATEQGYRRIWIDRDGKPGWLNNGATRSPMLDTFDTAVRDGNFRTDDVYALREMRTFVVDPHGRPVHAKGARDDLVLTLAIGYDAICRPQTRRSGRSWIDDLPSA